MYEVILPRRIRKRLTRRLPESAYGRLLEAIRSLAEDPRPRGAAKMRGMGGPEDWRIRIGDYRVIYRVDDETGEVLILAAGHRGSVYG